MLKLGNIKNKYSRRVCISLAIVIALIIFIVVYIPLAILDESIRAWNNLTIISELKLRLTELYDAIRESW